ncbi:cytochrome c oxidase subunit 2 [Melghirimyces profundicolus]|uniref:Cytochrome c oxidase subunit 2 n=1 Tax=Melghirimyces profundicolus TaxID=1242148 RepID=A0A2T6BXB9_9BACL|nr:cytochrome c oxidase subunit II [Melghirimyces profundicolus]PTX60724.1 cytochrome c oxidase subunit 2 [Melghirimyces profundicolus]
MKRCLPASGAAMGILTAFSLLTGCGNHNMSALDPQGPVGKSELNLIYLSTGIMTFVVVVVTVIYIYVVWRYRERPGDEEKGIPEQVAGSKKLEVLWTVIPIMLLIVLAVPTIATTFSLKEKPDPADSLRINVTGYQYWWGFEYPEQKVTTANEVHIPTGKKVDLIMTAHDVIHAFWVPSLGGKQDLSPGKTDRLVLQADKPGIYEGKCAELCGASHSLMNFRVIAHEPKDFDQWISSQQNPKSRPTVGRAEEGRRWVEQNCIGCHAVRGAGYRVLGRTGPELTAFGERTRIAGVLDNNRDNLKAWLKNPQDIKPGNRMPAFDHLSEKDLDAIVNYLQELK